MKKRGLCLLAGTMLMLGACGEEKAVTGEEAAASADRVDNLTIGLHTDVGPLNIYTGNLDWMTDLVYDKLFSPSPYVDEPIPWLAESAEQLDDKTWTVKLRSGIKWHDGEDFTAEDVKFTYEYFRDGPANRHTHHVSEVPKIDAIEIEDSGDSVRFECAYACPSLASITFADLPILPEHIWSEVKNPRKFTDLAVGTGPYELTDYQSDQSYQFEANDEYFMGTPTVGSLTMPVIKDSTAMFNALRSGEIDASSRTVPAELVSSFAAEKSLKLAETSALSIVQFGVNYEMAPFNEGEFRNALSLAVDGQSIVDTILLGQGKAGDKGYPHPASPWTNPELSTPFDLTKASKAFDKLGYKDVDGDSYRETPEGKEMSFAIKVSAGEPIYVRAAELLVEQMKQVGLHFEVKAVDATTFAADIAEDNFESYVSLIGPHGVADPDQFIMSHKSGYLWSKELEYPEMDKLTSDWMAASTIEARKEISFEIQELYNSQPTAIALYYPQEIFAYNSAVFDQYVESLGYGIINKYSFLPEETQQAVSATQPELID
ncbi:ABC transporter substrate-binding protein [Microbacterium sp. APC 3898]|uniref:ABC transporter substrate-binding protein n=1 Tax=Planococcus notacanthi TaxID=3035188 RepID=A0ABT7ZGZ4_9BACL|nr:MULTISPECIES: ABC transporter substrate-binding protein [Terrabacteria group]MDN3426435.1 ABC transporter substrate-binding protein [Planococcus sp. APC 4016]MDN3498130.1 ABC transporter substrate-binding protein [Microbacterium sp. APC 3898]